MLKKFGGVVVACAPGLAFADVPAAVTTAITEAGTDMVTVASAVFVAVIGLLAFRLMRRAAS